jgi:hypothetical protein
MVNYQSGACTTVANGGVGESGASSFLLHQVSGASTQVAVLRNVESSLCPNTGAVGVLVVNGQPTAQADISEAGSSIQSEVSPGDVVAAIVHTVPRFNEIACVRLGELSVVLEICDLV